MKVKIKIPEGKRAEWKNGVLTLVEDESKGIRGRVRTLDDAIDILGKDHPMVLDYYGICGGTNAPDIRAYAKLRVIVAALNEGWKPTFDEGKIRYYPWFVVADGGVAYADAYYTSSDACSHAGSRLVLKTRELAVYVGKRFVDIWRDYLLG